MEVYSAIGPEQVTEGRLICRNCSNWFRIENGIADLLPSRLRGTNYQRFGARTERFASKHGLAAPEKNAGGQGSGAAGKTKPIGAFEDVDDYERRVVNSPYYLALDQVCFYDWMERNLSDRNLVLDVGCGTGRQCIPLAERHIRVIGIDVDEDMLEEASRKVGARKLERFVDLIVADGERPPVKKNSFSACVLYGVLHHLSEKRGAVANAGAKLEDGGFMYSLDPHKGPARFVFDFLMKVWQLYVEEASEDPLINEAELLEWMTDAGLEGAVRLSTYLPPHVFIFGFKGNVWLLRMTDRIFRSVPGLRNIAGVITFEGRKRTASS